MVLSNLSFGPDCKDTKISFIPKLWPYLLRADNILAAGEVGEEPGCDGTAGETEQGDGRDGKGDGD